MQKPQEASSDANQSLLRKNPLIRNPCQDTFNLHPEFLLLPEEERFNLLHFEILIVERVSNFLKWVEVCKFSVKPLPWPTSINY